MLSISAIAKQLCLGSPKSARDRLREQREDVRLDDDPPNAEKQETTHEDAVML